MQDYSYFMGKDGFTWFVGCVEDRNDPERLGRVRVRCLGYHTEDKSKIPTEDLPWASVMMPVTTPSMNGLGETPSFLTPGSWVIGFFTDSQTMQEPVVMGTLPGRNSVDRDKSKGFNDPTNEYTSDFGPYPLRLNEPDVNRLGIPSLIHGNRETRDGAYTKDVPIALASGLGLAGTLFSIGGTALGLGVGAFQNATSGGFLSDFGVSDATGGSVLADSSLLADNGGSILGNVQKGAQASGVHAIFGQTTSNLAQGIGEFAQAGVVGRAAQGSASLFDKLGAAFKNLSFKGFTNIVPRTFASIDSAQKVAVTAQAVGRLSSGNLSPGGVVAALAATPIGSEIINTVAEPITDSLTGLISEETSGFLTDNFGTIVDVGTAAYQLADGDTLLGLTTGITATFNAFNADTHIDIGDYKVSLPQVTNTLSDVIKTGLLAPTTKSGYILAGAKLLSAVDPLSTIGGVDERMSRYLYDSVTVDSQGNLTSDGAINSITNFGVDASTALARKFGEDYKIELQKYGGRIPTRDENPQYHDTIVDTFRSTQSGGKVFNSSSGWNFVNNSTNDSDLNGLSDALSNLLPEYDASKGANFNSSGMAITQNWLDTAKYLQDTDGNFVNRNDAVTDAFVEQKAKQISENLLIENRGKEKELILRTAEKLGVDISIKPDPVANAITIETQTGRRVSTGPTTTSGGTWSEPRTTDVNFTGARVGGISNETGQPRSEKMRVDPEYPYNHARETESGHIKEYDDTPGAERIMEFHRTGTFYEVDSDGTKMTRVVGHNYEVIAGNDFVNIKGSCNLTIDQNCNTYIKGNWNIQVDGSKTEVIKGSRMTMIMGADTLNIAAMRSKVVGAAESNAIGGAQTDTVGGAQITSVGGFISRKAGAKIADAAGGAFSATAGGFYKVTAPRIDLN
tara:strand:- start:21 stop:2744 length:2724 start_codon:yes stop_codon:yes gene_type:complete